MSGGLDDQDPIKSEFNRASSGESQEAEQSEDREYATPQLNHPSPSWASGPVETRQEHNERVKREIGERGRERFQIFQQIRENAKDVTQEQDQESQKELSPTEEQQQRLGQQRFDEFRQNAQDVSRSRDDDDMSW